MLAPPEKRKATRDRQARYRARRRKGLAVFRLEASRDGAARGISPRALARALS